MSYKTTPVELTRNDIKLLKKAVSKYRNTNTSMNQREVRICMSLYKYLDAHLKEGSNVEDRRMVR